MIIDTEPLYCTFGKDVEYIYPKVEEEILIFNVEAEVSEEGELIVWAK